MTATASNMTDRFNQPNYLVRRKVFKLAGAAFHIYGPGEQLVLYSKLKAFKLKEDIRLYTGEDMQTEVLRIAARSIIDFSAAYDVFDSATNQKIGALQRKGLKSIIQDEWIVLDAHDQEVGTIKEDSTALALLRRFVEISQWFFPQVYNCQIQGQPAAIFKQNINPFVQKISIDFGVDTAGIFDRRLGIAAAILLNVIEGRQS